MRAKKKHEIKNDTENYTQNKVRMVEQIEKKKFTE